MFRKKWFWILFIVVFAGTVFFNIKNFDKLGDIIDIDLKMNRHDALAKAEELTSANKWGPENAKLAAVFDRDWSTKTYIELEHGGTKAFKELLESGFYSPFTWKVRAFQTKETNEATVFFTPAGDFYGFEETLPENQPGAALPADSVLPIIQEGIRKWKIPMRHYDYLENSNVERPSGRVDHTFTYERDGWEVGEARIRLDFTVSGDELTGIEHYVYIPEGFYDRYSEMRTANEIISGLGTFAMGVLYILIGCIGSILYFLRKKLISWRMPIIVGFVISFLALFLGSLNSLPLNWFFYDTAISPGSFIFDQILGAFLNFVSMWAVFTISFIAAETLSRIAFPNHINFWKVWSKKTAASKEIAGFTVTGLLLVSFFIMYQLVLHMITKNIDGWWSPSSSMIDPNVLAMYFPWYTPLATALQAGFWEECLFRAVPLAGAVLLGRKFKREKLFVVLAVVLQAIIFGAAHANYAQQPSFARVIELIIPSIVFALLYLNFGLLPGIVMHFAYDAVLMATPVYSSTAKGMIVSKIIASVLILVPLWVFVIRRLTLGKWHEISYEDLNSSWKAPETPELEQIETQVDIPKPSQFKAIYKYLIPILGVLGIVAWGLFTRFDTDAPVLEKSRAEAIELADRYMKSEGIKPGEEWKRLTSFGGENGLNDQFIWEHSDPATYKKLLLDYEMGPGWKVKYAKFSGEVENRQEKYYVDLIHDGKLQFIKHTIPEHWEDATLDANMAKDLAFDIIHKKFAINPMRLKLISAEPEKLPNRRDWVLTFEDKASYPLDEGEGRIEVLIQGGNVADCYRYVHIPEEWEREQRDHESSISKLRIVSIVILGVFLGMALVLGIIGWTKKQLDMKMFIVTAIFIFIISALGYYMNIPSITNRFITAQPFNTQLLLGLVMISIGFVLMGISIGLGTGFLQNWYNGPFSMSRKMGIINGFFAGAFIAGILALVKSLMPETMPLWPSFANANTSIPIIGGVFGSVRTFILAGILMTFIMRIVEKITAGWSKSKIWGILILIAAGIGMVGTAQFDTFAQWIIQGLSTGVILVIVYLTVFRFRSSTAIMATATFFIFGKLATMLRGGYPGIQVDSIISIIAIAAVAIYWCSTMSSAEKKLEAN